MKSPAPRGALAALSLSMLLASLGTSIANVGLPSLVQAFDALINCNCCAFRHVRPERTVVTAPH